MFRNRAAVMVDGDNVCHAFRGYGRYLPLDRISEFLLDDDRSPFGVTEVTQVCYFKSYVNPLMPIEGELPFTREGLKNVHRHNYLSRNRWMGVGPDRNFRRVGAYPDRDIWEHALDLYEEWDTLFIVTSDVKDFGPFADAVRECPKLERHEAVIVGSHLLARTGWAEEENNALAIEDIYPELMSRFVDLRGYHPEQALTG